MPPPPAYLLDTNILVHYARKSVAGQAVEARFQFQASAFKPLVCVVTLGEIRGFARTWGIQKQAQLQGIVNKLVIVDINSPDLLDAFADIRTFLGGRFAIGDNDVWIAAATKVTGAKLITTDKDFDPLHPTIIQRIYVDPHTGAIS